jgi:hypothetical protein
MRLRAAMPFQKTEFVQIFRISSSAHAGAGTVVLFGELMAVTHAADVPQFLPSTVLQRATGSRLIIPGVEVMREG